MSKYGYDIINGEKVSQLVVTDDYEIIGKHSGTVHLENGTLYISGKLSGTLVVYEGANVIVNRGGKQSGTVSLYEGAIVQIKGSLSGTTSIPLGAKIIIEENAKMFGTTTNNGLVVIRGVFAGATSGNGEFIIEGNGYIKEPTIRDGVHYYS